MATKYFVSTSSTSFNTAANWSDGVAPANGDTLIFNSLGTADCTTNLGSALTGVTLIVEQSYAGSIGVLSGATATYLTLTGVTAYIGRPPANGSASGSPLIMIDGGTSPTFVIYDSATTSGSTYYPPILLKGTSMTLTQQGGNVGVAVLPGATASGTFSLADGPGNVSPILNLGSGTTVTALTVAAGVVTNLSANTTTAATVESGTYTYSGTGAHTTLTINGGTVNYDGTGTITTATNYGSLVFSRDPRSKTVTTLTCYGGSSLDIDTGTAGGIVFTNPILFPDGISNVTLKTPRGVKADIDAMP